MQALLTQCKMLLELLDSCIDQTLCNYSEHQALSKVLIGVASPCPEIPQWYNWGCQVRICIVKIAFCMEVLT